MKKLLLISILLTIQCACTTSAPKHANGPVLLSFADLSAEIQVQHEISKELTPTPDAAASP